MFRWVEEERDGWVTALRIMEDGNGEEVVAELRVFPIDPVSVNGEWTREARDLPVGGLATRHLRKIRLFDWRPRPGENHVDVS